MVVASVSAVIVTYAGPRVVVAQRPVDAQTVVQQWTKVNRRVAVVDSAGRGFVRFDEASGMGLAWTPLDFADGEIEVDIRGRDVMQRSFVGVAFHVVNDTAFDAVYLRPFNFRATDSTRHVHAIQYISQPSYPWERLRGERPGRYEQPVLPEPNPNAWVHLRLVVRGADVAAFVNGNASPALHVQALGERTRGGVGLWVGEGSPGDFANLVVRPQAR
jgi:hypothetical protein